MKKTLPALLAAGLLQSPLALACESGETFFIARQDASFSQQGDSWAQGFSISGDSAQTLILRFASVYRATAIIIDAADTQTFLDGGSVSYYDGFENNFGTNSLNLGPGEYALAIRNNTDGANNYSVELDCVKTFADATRFDSTTVAETVSANGGKLWQPIEVNSGFRLWIDGANYGLETFLIPEVELENFKSGNTFNYYTDFSSTSSGGFPGGYEIELPDGNYYLAFRNPQDADMPVTYTWEYFEKIGDGSNGGVAIDGSSSFSIESGWLSAEIASLVNTRGADTQPLRLLWLASPDGTLDSVYTIAEFDLDEIQNLGDGSLATGGSFESLSLTTAYDAPPAGSYHIILAVVETSDPDTVLDSVTYDTVVNLGDGGGEPTSSSSSSQAESSVASSEAESSEASSEAESSAATSSSASSEAATSSESSAATSSSSSSAAESSEASSDAESSAASSQATNNNSGGGGGGGGGSMSWLSLLALTSLGLMRRRRKK